MRQKKSFMSWLLFGLMLAMTLAPTLAFAQDQVSGTTYNLPDTDLSKKTFIDPLFGPLVDGNLKSPLTSLILVFNGALLTVAGIMLLYTILGSTLATAHDGEMLGKKWSTLYVPIRTSLGAAAMMPVVNGGWCVAQVVVIWLAMQGAAMANLMWDKFIGQGDSLITSATYAPPSTLSAIRKTYTTMFMNATCVASKEGIRQASGADSDLNVMNQVPYSSRIVKDNDQRFWIAYGESSVLGMITSSPASPVSPTTCGTVALEESTYPQTKIWNGLTNNTGSMLINPRADEMMGPLVKVRRNEFKQAKIVTDDLAVRMVQGVLTQEEFNTEMDKLLESYSKNMTQVAQETFANNMNTDFLNKMKQDGWINAGAFYVQMARAQDQITRTITNAPVVALPKFSDSRIGGNMNNMATAISEYVSGNDAPDELERASNFVRSYSSSMGGALSGVGENSVDPGSSEWSTKFVNWFINEDSALGIGVPDTNENPIMMAKNLGDKMTATAWGALGAAALAGMFTIGGAGVGTAVLLAPIFALVFSSLVVPGAMMSTYLPLMPYIMWLGVVLAWGIMLFEAIIAAPLWMLVHLSPDADGIVGKGGQGYMLILSLVLRPPLMIMGLVASFVLMKPIGQLVNSTFVGAFSIAVTPGVFGLTQAVAGCIIYCVVMMILVQRVFSLMHVIPDRLLRWIGGDQGGVGEQAQAAGEGMTRVGAALGVQQAVGQAAQTASTTFRQTRAEAIAREGKVAQEVGNAEHQLGTDIKDARASGSKADRQGDANSHQAASAAFETAGLQGYRTAAAQAENQGRRDPEAKKFSKGLEAARKNGTDREFLDTAGAEASRKEQNYMEARSRIAQGNPQPGDEDTVRNQVPRQFEQTLARAHAAMAASASHMQKAQGVGSGGGGGSDSIREARRNPVVQAPSNVPNWSIDGQEGGSGRGNPNPDA